MALEKKTRLMAVQVQSDGTVIAKYTDFIYEDGVCISSSNRREYVEVAEDAGPDTPEVQALGIGLIASAQQLAAEAIAEGTPEE